MNVILQSWKRWVPMLDGIRRRAGRVRSLIVSAQRVLFRRHSSSRMEIDHATVLPTMSLEALTTVGGSGQTVVVPEVSVKVKAHELSVPSAIPREREAYSDHTYRAPEMTLERLSDHYWFPESGFLVSKAGKVWRHSVLAQYGDPNFLTTWAVEERRDRQGGAELIFYEHLLRSAPVIEGSRLITSHYASHNFGHFMLDMVPLIQLGMRLGLSMISRPLLEWQGAIYRRVGVDPSSVRVFTERVVFLRDVFVSNRHNAVSTYAASPHHRAVFNAILSNVPKSTSRAAELPRIFLSRGESRNRILRNREDLEMALRNEGFGVVRPQNLSFDEQALLFSRADIIVSEFGAIMANVVFCKPRTKVIEIIPENQNDPWSAHLCASLDLDHVTKFQKVRDEDRESLEIGGRNHTNIYFEYEVDIDRIVDTVRKLRRGSEVMPPPL